MRAFLTALLTSSVAFAQQAPTSGGGYSPGGTDVALADGGTNKSMTADNGAICYSDADSLELLASTSTSGQMLRSGASSAPVWSTASWPATTTVNQVLYSSSANVVAGLATANSSVLVTSAGGVPSLASDIPTAVTIGGAYDYRAGGTDVSLLDGGTGASLASGTSGQVIQSQGSSAATWSTATYPATTTASQMLYSSATNTVTGLATANSSILATDGSGIPSLTTTMPTGMKVGGQTLTAGTATYTNAALVGLTAHRFDITNAMVVALGAGTTGDIKVATLPAFTVVAVAYLYEPAACTFASTLTASLGYTGAGYVDLLNNADMKNGQYLFGSGGAGERGANNLGGSNYDWKVPSITTTKDVYTHWISGGSALNTVTGCTVTVYLFTYTLP